MYDGRNSEVPASLYGQHSVKHISPVIAISLCLKFPISISRSEGKQRPNGKIIVVPEQLQSCRDKVIMKWKASKLSRKDFVGKSDPFMVFYKQNVDGR